MGSEGYRRAKIASDFEYGLAINARKVSTCICFDQTSAKHVKSCLMNYSTSQMNVQKKLDLFMQEFRDGKHEGSVISSRTTDSLSTDERQAWRTIRKDLEDIGISVAAFDANKDFIVNWFKTAISTGAFEEQTVEGETSSIISHDGLSQSLEDPKRDTSSSQHIEDPEHATVS